MSKGKDAVKDIKSVQDFENQSICLLVQLNSKQFLGLVGKKLNTTVNVIAC